MTKLSPEQERARGLSEDTLLRAGAGAGKTTTLLQALLDDLQEIAPSKLAVVTFTRNAAASLRSRLEEELYRAGRSGTSSQTLWLGTIDALAARILREKSLLLGLSPDIHPGSESEMRRLSAEALRACSPNKEALRAWIDPERDLLSLLIRLDEECTARGLRPWSASAPEPRPEPLREKVEELLGESLTEKQTALLREDWFLLEKTKMLPARSWNVRRADLRPLVSEAEALREEYRRDWIEAQAEPVREAFLDVFEEWRSHRQRLSKERGIWSFADIIDQAEALEVEPFIEKMYLDEAQDTSPAQFRFLRSVLCGPLICVGDPNQSIYGFRNADLDNFRQQTKSMKQVELRDNYRSAPEIISYLENLCRPLLGEDLLRMKAAGSPKRGEVRALELRDRKKTPSPRAEAEALVPLLWAELERLDPGDISVLFRSNADLDLFYQIWRQKGLPVAAMRSGGLLLQEECLDILAYLQLLLDPEDEGLLLRVLSSPFVGLGPDELLDYAGDFERAKEHLQPFLSKALQMLGQRPLSQIGEWLLEAHSFDVALDLLDSTGARSGNVENLLGLLRNTESEYEGMLYGPLLERFREILREEKPDLRETDAILLQTVHQAKGEEYRCVILPRLGRKLPTTSRRKFFLNESGELGIALPGALRDSCAEILETEYCQADREEEARLLYVALTRAQEKLVLLASGRSEKELPGLLPVLPGAKPPPEEKQRVQQSSAQEEPVRAPARPERLPRIFVRDISWSDLVSWNRCSLRRFLEGELRLSASSEEGGSGARQSGQRVHEAIDRIIRQQPLPELSRREREMVEKAKSFIDPEAQSEQSFSLALGPYLLRGRIDFCRQGEEWIVRDWKTGSEEEWQEDYALQRKIYALFALRSGAKSVCSETIYLSRDKKESKEWHQDDLPQLQEEILFFIEEILARPQAPAADTRQPFCSGCSGTEKICPVSREVGAADQHQQKSEANPE